MWKPAKPLFMKPEQQATLETWVKAKTTPQRVVLRSRICLLAANGLANNAIAQKLGVSRPTIILWRNRFEENYGSEMANLGVQFHYLHELKEHEADGTPWVELIPNLDEIDQIVHSVPA